MTIVKIALALLLSATPPSVLAFVPSSRRSGGAVAAFRIPSTSSSLSSLSELYSSSSAAAEASTEKAPIADDVDERTDDAVDGEAAAAAEILWEPDPAEMVQTSMARFAEFVNLTSTTNYEDLWQWSVDNSDTFWSSLMTFLEVQYTGNLTPVRDGDTMPDVTYFPDVELNFAENLLKHGAPGAEMENSEALVSVSEARGTERWTFGELRDDASRVRAALEGIGSGVGADDACGAFMPNVGQTVVAMLGTTSLGAVWSSCSIDFGAKAVADRFGQIGPKVLFTVDGYVSAGKKESVVAKVEELVKALPTLEKVVVLRMLDDEPRWSDDKVKSLIVDYDDFLASGSNSVDGSAPEPKYTPVPFSKSQFVLYSSGTTGLPKSIAHGAGNVLLQHAKELMLHSDLRPGDRMLYFTTCGWMMWNWMVSSLYAGAAVITFDGFAAYPKMSSPWDLVADERITHMGTTPRYLQASRKRVRPSETHDLSNLRVVFSTGSPLLPEDFDYVYSKVKDDVMLASISGGTDICSCFVLGNPLLPVRKGELTAFGLGLDACALDRDTGEAVTVGEKAELACRSPFVAAPVCFFGDDENKSKYRAAYFDSDDDGSDSDSNDDGIWYHGDLIEVTGSVGQSGGVIIHGRSDTTLKPGGVRIGTAEVYRFAETVNVVDDSLVIGDKITSGRRAGDVRVVLFVKLAEAKGGSGDNGDCVELTEEVEEQIRSAIREGASDAHVPAIIRQVAKIPYTRSGKKVELAVRDLFQGVEPRNVGALQDATAFDEYRKMAKEGLD